MAAALAGSVIPRARADGDSVPPPDKAGAATPASRGPEVPTPQTMAPGPTMRSTAPGKLPGEAASLPSPRAQFGISMRIVDGVLASLAPSIASTVRGLKHLALAGAPADPARARAWRRALDAHVRALSADQQRLSSMEKILARWRAGAAGSPEANMMMVSGVQRRTAQISAQQRQIACGRYFAAVAAHPPRGYRGARPPAPPGC